MSKITLNNVGSLLDATTAATTINTNSAAIVTAMDNTLSRDGTSPNQMGAALDMNNNRIINLPAPSGINDPVRLQDVTGSSTIDLSITLDGDVTSPTGNGTLTTTIADNAVTNAKLADSSVDSSKIVDGSVTNSDLATMPTKTIKSNITDSTAAVADNTLTSILDSSVSTSQGSLLYRDSSTWSALAPGTAGQYLQTNGSSANPAWVTILSSPTLTPEQFGAVGNGATDDTAALQAFLDACENSTGVFTPGKTYMYGNNTAVGLYVRNNSYLIGYGATIKALVTAGQNRTGFNITDNTQGTSAGPQNVTILGLTLNGNATARRAGGAFSGVGNVGGFYAVSANHLTIRDCIALDTETDGFYIGGDNNLGGVSNYFYIENCYASGNSRNGFSIVGAQYGSLHSCQASSISYGQTQGNFSLGYDFEPNGSSSPNKNVTASNCSAISCSLEGFGMHGLNAWQTNINWINCYAESCGTGFASGTAGSSVRIIGARFAGNTTDFSNCAEAIASFP